jgi:hypothetical protein
MDAETTRILEEIRSDLEDSRGARAEWRYWVALAVPVLTAVGVILLQVVLR